MRKQYFVANNLWEGLLWFPWSCRSTQTSYASFRPQTGHWHDGTKWSEMMIYLARWNKKQTKTDGSFPFYSPLARARDSEFNWKIVFSKVTSRISKPLSVFDKLGLGLKYGGEGTDSVSAHRVKKKKCNVTGDAQIKSQRRVANQPGGKKEGTVN